MSSDLLSTEELDPCPFDEIHWAEGSSSESSGHPKASLLLPYLAKYSNLHVSQKFLHSSKSHSCNQSYIFTESKKVTLWASLDGPNVIVSFVSACKLSSLVNGMSYQRALFNVTVMVLPNNYKRKKFTNEYYVLLTSL